MKNVYVSLLLLFIGFASTAQTKWNLIRVTVIEVAHNYECCTDAGGFSCGFLKNSPEPRFKITARYGTASSLAGYYNKTIDLGNSVDCGTISRNDLLLSISNITADRLWFDTEMWEDDYGSSSSFDQSINGSDDNHTRIQKAFLLSNFNTGSDTLTLSGSGGYYMKLKIDLSPAPLSEIKISGNSTEIASGGTTTSATDSTHLGQVLIGDSQLVNYTIENIGTKILSLTGSPLVSISGTDASDFSVVSQPKSTVSINGKTEFVVMFKPSALGTKNATISIANDDSDENPYTFALKGEATCGLRVSGTATEPSCSGNNDGKVQLNITGGTSPYTHGYYALNETFLGSFSQSAFNSVYMNFKSTANGLELTPNATQSFFHSKEKFPLNDGTQFNASIFIPNGAYITTMIGFSKSLNATSGFQKAIYFSSLGNGSIDVYALNNGGGIPFSTKKYSLSSAGEWFDVRISVGSNNTELAVKKSSELSFTNTKTLSYTPNTETLYLDVYQSNHPVLGYGTTIHKNWQVGVASPDTNNLFKGKYEYIIQDASGCADTAIFELKEPDPLKAVSTIDTVISCYGGSNGRITATSSGGSQPYSYLWSHSGWGNTQATTASVAGLSQGTYYVDISDRNNCTTKDTVVLQSPSEFTVPVMKKNVSCFGGNDGQARFAIFYEDFEDAPDKTFSSNTQTLPGLKNQWTYHQDSSGVGQLVLTNSIGAYHSGNKAAGLQMGGYRNAQSLRATVNLAQYKNTDLKLSFWYNDVGDEDDLLDVVRMRGDTSDVWFTVFDWNNGSNPGWEHVVIDLDSALAANGQSISAQTQISFDETDGTPFPIPTDGVLFDDISIYSPQHSISWGRSSNNWFRDSLSVGSYIATIRNQKGCTFTDTVIITQPSVLSTTVHIDSAVTCSGQNDAQFSASSQGGTKPYQYEWGDKSTNDTLSDQFAGLYFVEATDSLGCKAVDTIVATQPSSLKATISVNKHVTCYGGKDGQATVKPNGGTAPYRYKWSNGDTTAIVKNLSKGSHSNTVTDKNGCQVTQTTSISEPKELVASAKVDQNPSCYGDKDGIASVLVNGGSAPYTYEWSNRVTTKKQMNMSAGSYGIKVFDQKGCMDSVSLTLTEPTAISLSTSVDKHVSCKGEKDGMASVVVSGGNTPYTYSWINQSNQTAISQLSAGTYQVVVEDAKGCQDSSSVTIKEPTVLSLNTTATDISCFGDADGKVQLNITGGTAPYIHGAFAFDETLTGSLNKSMFDSVNMKLKPTSKGLELTPNALQSYFRTKEKFPIEKGAIFTSKVFIPDAGYIAHFIGLTDGSTSTQGFDKAVYFSNNSGSLKVFAINEGGGLYFPKSGYSLSSGGDWFDVRISVGASAVELAIKKSSESNFTNTKSYSYSNLDSLYLGVYSSKHPSYARSTTIHKNWKLGMASDDTVSLAKGSYNYLIQDANGCVASAQSSINEPSKLSVTVSIDTAISCKGANNGAISAFVSGGSKPFSYKWTYSSSGIEVATTGSAVQLSANRYYLTINDSNKCQVSKSVNLTEPDELKAGVLGAVSAICANEKPKQIAPTSKATGGTPNYSYQWQISMDGSSFTDISGAQAESYQPSQLTKTTWYRRKVNDANQCGNAISNVVKVVVNPLPMAYFSTSDNCFVDSMAFTDGSTISSGSITSWSWSFGDSNTSNVQHPKHLYVSSGTYKAQLVVTSQTGCKDTMSESLIVNPKPIALIDAQNACDYQSVSFASKSYIGGNGQIAKSQWSLGDGNVSTSSKFQHKYKSQGSYKIQLVVISDSGCVDSTSKTLFIHPQPSAGFKAPQNCFYGASEFINTSSIAQGKLTNYQWKFGDNKTSNQTSPKHAYASPGTYAVALIATSDSGCLDTVSQILSVNPKPRAAFAANDTCVYESLNFTNKTSISSGTIASYSWSFGDGKTSPKVAPAHLYKKAGNYTAELIVVSDSGCSDTFNQRVWAHAQPSVQFSINTVCQENFTLFKDGSTVSNASIANWKWNLGDGSTSSVQNPKNQYQNSGDYSVQLIATSNYGCSDTAMATAKVHPKPSAKFVSAVACEDEQVQFIDSSKVSSGKITAYAWDFGNVSTSRQQNPINVYKDTGLYQTALVVSTDQGCKDTFTQMMNVNPVPSSKFKVLNVCVSNQASFTNLSSLSRGTLKYKWSFGDSTVSSLGQPKHQYPLSGFYQVQLSTISDQGCADSTAQTLQVYALPSIQYSAANVCVGETSSFSNASSGAKSFYWTFGDGNISKAGSPKNYYKNSGKYIVKLVGASKQGCKDSVQKQVEVYSLPVPSFNSNVACLTDTSRFKNNSSNSASYSWNMGDGSSSVLQSPTHLYGQSGNYSVQLIATSAEGCMDTLQKTTVVNALPKVAFITQDVCDGQVVAFSNRSSGASSHQWNFGDGKGSSSTNTNHKYATTGIFDVKLISTTTAGCSDSTSGKVEVFANPKTKFSQKDICAGSFMNFVNQTTIAKGLATYHWDLGDLSTTSNVSPKHQYASSGSYVVKLVGKSDKGCKDSISQTATVYAMPLPAFTAKKVCHGETTQFANTSTGAINYSWVLGDGQIESGISINHIYKEEGEYKVKLIATSSNNCRDSVTDMVSVWRKPAAAFVHDSVCDGNSLQFTNTSYKGPIDQYEWKLGDGTKSAVANPQHTYGTAGSYQVELIVTSDMGCKDTANNLAQVHPNPKVAFTGNNVCAYDTLKLTNLTSISSGSISTYLWNLGDGSTQNDTNANKWYEKPGSYSVRLTATSNFGCMSANDSLFEVYDLPIAAFMADAVCDGFPTQFKNQSSTRLGTIVQHDWEFGDGKLSSLPLPSHAYATNGTYSAQLITTTNHGCVDTAKQMVLVHQKPVASFAATSVCNNASTQFSNTSKDAQQWFWNFGDKGGLSEQENPNYEYLNPGTYNTVLRVVSDQGCEDTFIKAVEVYELPTAIFSVLNHCLNDEIRPDEASMGSIGEWNWEFGDGTHADGSAPSHTYALDGEYLIGLHITDDHGCEDSVVRKVVVHPLPVVNIHNDTLVSKGYAVNLWATGGDSYQWFPSTGLGNSDVQNPVAVVSEDIEYTVTVTTAHGCAKDTFVNLRMREDYTLEPSNVMTPDGNGQNDKWVVEKAVYYNDVEVVVFDRWGRIVYQSQSYQNNWDGTVNGKALPDGAYFYVVKVPHERESYKGSLTIFR